MSSGFDAIVVGAGAGGAAAAWRLCQSGRQVLLLEAGPRFIAGEDYHHTADDWERGGFPHKQGSTAKVTFGDLGTISQDHKDLFSWNAVQGRLAADGARSSDGVGYHHVQGLGGSTLAFVGEAHRLNPRSMKLKSHHGVGLDWPISYEDLEPYYGLCESVLGVAGETSQAAERWRSSPYPLPPHPPSPGALALEGAAQRLGLNWHINPRSALSKPYEDRPSCNYCGQCSKGCPLEDKGSADVTFLRKAKATGRLTIETGASVTGFSLDGTGAISSLRFVQNGVAQTASAPLFVLAAGAVNTPRLLLSANIANTSRLVGRNFMETLYVSATGFLPKSIGTHRGLPADMICWDFNAPDAVEGIVGGFRLSHATQEIGLLGPIAYVSRLLSGFGHPLKEALREKFGAALSVGAIGEVLPNAASYVDLDPEEKDGNGLPVARINSVLQGDGIQRLRAIAFHSKRLLAAAGVTELSEFLTTYDRFASTHVFGTCAMGDDPRQSVVDRNCVSHDHSNLLIVDASVFPSTGGGESPSLTIQALATRAIDQYLKTAATN
ncbi:GMC oxidoreductase [Pseudovibrio flavus]|uniref:GMC oxidoreductase n=1 Tax=Pseudovibrio flavus TaxID=2529854 RepID=UPI0012BB54B0|nr:GMC family oxidoreductase [Pseudovibrio flavus]